MGWGRAGQEISESELIPTLTIMVTWWRFHNYVCVCLWKEYVDQMLLRKYRDK